MLLTKQKNQLLQIMTDRNIFPHHVFKHDSAQDFFEIKFRDGPFFFQITPHEGNLGDFNILSLPKIGRTEIWGHSWLGVTTLFADWSEEIREELQTPDLWAQFESTAQIFAAPAAPDEKFTNHELRELQSQLRAAEAKLTTSGLPEAAILALTAALRDAAPKAETMTKKDWQNMVVGAVVSTLTGLALSADHVQAVYQILKATFTGWLLH